MSTGDHNAPAPGLEHLIASLKAGLVGQPRVVAAFLHGSRATGRGRTHSDIDVAVLLDPPADDQERYGVVGDLIAALAVTVAADRLHVTLLDDAPPAFAFQVAKHGRLIVSRDEAVVHRFKVSAYRRHADFAHVEAFFREVTKRRLLNGGSHG